MRGWKEDNLFGLHDVLGLPIGGQPHFWEACYN
jgi:hypothetical protein